MIMFSYYTGLSVAKQFLGGLIPGSLVGLGLMVVNAVYCRIRGYDAVPRAHGGAKFILRAIVRSLGGLMIPLIIVVGIAGGVFTPTESGARRYLRPGVRFDLPSVQAAASAGRADRRR